MHVFSESIDKIRGKTHSTSSRCAACKLNTVERSDDLSNKTGLKRAEQTLTLFTHNSPINHLVYFLKQIPSHRVQ